MKDEEFRRRRRLRNTISYKDKRSARDLADQPIWGIDDWGFERTDDPVKTILKNGKLNGSGC